MKGVVLVIINNGYRIGTKVGTIVGLMSHYPGFEIFSNI
jgi:hypothetical protein